MDSGDAGDGSDECSQLEFKLNTVSESQLCSSCSDIGALRQSHCTLRLQQSSHVSDSKSGC